MSNIEVKLATIDYISQLAELEWTVKNQAVKRGELPVSDMRDVEFVKEAVKSEIGYCQVPCVTSKRANVKLNPIAFL